MLTPQQVTTLRSLKRTAIVLLTIYQLDGPVGRNEIASILDMDPATVSKYLKSLSHLGLINRTDYRDGYILTTGGRQYILGQSYKLDKALSPVNPGTQDTADNAQSPVNPGTQVVADGAHHHAFSSDGHAPDETKVENFHFESGNSPLSGEEEEESINLIKKSSSSSKEETKVENFHFRSLPGMSLLLKRSDLLFGKGNHVREDQLPNRPPEIVLGWLAKAHCDRAHLSTPAGLVYQRLKAGLEPQPQYIEHPETFLPAEFLQAVGLGWMIEKSEVAELEKVAVPETEPESGIEPPAIEDPSIDQPVSKTTPRRAWAMALEQLRMDIPKATFEHWIANTRAKHYDLAQDILVVSTPTLQAQEWLEGRLTSTVTRLLTGLLCRTTSVKFEKFPGGDEC